MSYTLKKKYNKKQLKEYYNQFRSNVGRNMNTSTILFSSKKDYNRQKLKNELRKMNHEE